MKKNDRVTLSADDAITAFNALRSKIKATDEVLATGEFPSREYTVKYRAELVAAYERIAKVLGLKATLDEVSQKGK